eukprot:8055461-Alexandrium_andersonii.AAC.1
MRSAERLQARNHVHTQGGLPNKYSHKRLRPREREREARTYRYTKKLLEGTCSSALTKERTPAEKRASARNRMRAHPTQRNRKPRA